MSRPSSSPGTSSFIAAAETELDKLRETLSRFAAGGDELMQSALDTIAAALRDNEIQRLQHRAVRTPGTEDDRMVASIAEARAALADLKKDLGEDRRTYESQLAKLRELERVRQRFKARGMDDFRSAFKDPSGFPGRSTASCAGSCPAASCGGYCCAISGIGGGRGGFRTAGGF